MNRTEKRVFSIVALALVFEFFILKNLPFFWDGLSKAYRAEWIFSHNFSSLIVPTEYNSGHPPLWITSIALVWTLLGKSIWAARLLLLVVNIGAAYQLFLLCKKHFLPGISLLFFLLVAVDPTVMAQTTILNNDMLLLFFLLLGLNSLINQKWRWYTIAITGLLLTNLRGIYCTIAFGAIHFLYIKYASLTFNKKMLRAYVVGLVVFAGFLIVQYSELGWVLISKNKNYATHREAAGLARIAKNAAAYIKNILDFGRVFLWIPLGLMLLVVFRSKNKKLSLPSKRIFIALSVFLVVFFLGFVPFSNPMGPRYLMICFLLGAILFVNLLSQSILSAGKRKLLVGIIVFALFSGHFWIYPATIAQGWDSSLAYLNYFPEERKMFNYLFENDIPFDEIGTNLPLKSSRMAHLLDTKKFDPSFAETDFDTNRYFIFSNVENRTSDEHIIMMENNWKPVVTYSRLGVYLTLYENPAIKAP